MVSYKLTIAYDGTDFVGWQRQRSGVSIQGVLEQALSELDGRPVSVIGAGRTDAGVHAWGQAASVAIDRAIDPATLVRAANVRLPPSVRILQAVQVPDDFHARFHARLKSYRYRIWNADVMSPFERMYAWHMAGPAFDVAAMADAAARITGRHDFAAFQAAGSDTQTTVRTIFSSRVDRGPDAPLVTYDISGDGFLRHMVRTIVGTLVEVGRGRRPAAWVGDLLESRDRALAGPTAPPEGLFLMSVSYEL